LWLDVTFREDDSRVRDHFAADNLAWLKRFAISVLKQQTDKISIAMRRRMAGWNVGYLMQVLGITSFRSRVPCSSRQPHPKKHLSGMHRLSLIY
jgi:hypothetical protein